MRYEHQWTVDAVRDLERFDSNIADRITKKVSWFCNQNNPLRHAEQLTGQYKGVYRFRVGDYRTLFEKNERGQLVILMILRVKHRREAYK
ncbi:MAG: type II toxin-antitoxin system RelE/ParE family toxin [Patescibacteria group bacterium]